MPVGYLRDPARRPAYLSLVAQLKACDYETLSKRGFESPRLIFGMNLGIMRGGGDDCVWAMFWYVL